MEHVASKKLDEVLAYQKSSSDRSGLGYTGENSSSSKVSKEMKFVKAKEPSTPLVDNVKSEKETECGESNGFDEVSQANCH